MPWEGALKLKEISYIHAEGFAAGELKHGPIALVEPDIPVVAVALDDELRAKTLNAVEQIRSRNGRVILVATEGDDLDEGIAEDTISIPPYTAIDCADRRRRSVAVLRLSHRRVAGFWTWINHATSPSRSPSSNAGPGRFTYERHAPACWASFWPWLACWPLSRVIVRETTNSPAYVAANERIDELNSQIERVERANVELRERLDYAQSPSRLARNRQA